MILQFRQTDKVKDIQRISLFYFLFSFLACISAFNPLFETLGCIYEHLLHFCFYLGYVLSLQFMGMFEQFLCNFAFLKL